MFHIYAMMLPCAGIKQVFRLVVRDHSQLFDYASVGAPFMFITIPKRNPKRLRTFLVGFLETTGGHEEVRVRDIAKGGVLIEATNPPATGERITLSCSNHRFEGVVVWQEGARSGISFDRPLTAKEWKHFSGQLMRIGAPRNYRRDRIEADDEQIEVTPRAIHLRGTGRIN